MTGGEVPDDIEALNPYRGTDLWRLVRGRDLLCRLQEHLGRDDDLEWFLPPDILPGVTAYESLRDAVRE